MTASQAIPQPTKELTWDIKIHPVESGGTIATTHKAIHRDDNNERLSIVKKAYQQITNADFKGFMQQMAQVTGFSIEGYSAIGGGKTVVGYLKNHDSTDIAGFSNKQHMIVGNNFDKTKAFFTGSCNEMLRCTNQWGQIMVNHKVRHSSKALMKMDTIIRFYQDYIEQERKAKEKYETWHGINIPSELRELFVERTLEITDKKVSEPQRLALFDSVVKESSAMGNTAFALFNGATHFTTHILGGKNKAYGNMFDRPGRVNANAEMVIDTMIEEFSLN